MPASPITKTLTINSLTAAGEGRVTVGLVEPSDATAGPSTMGMGLQLTVSNAEAAGFAVHDAVTLTLAKA